MYVKTDYQANRVSALGGLSSSHSAVAEANANRLTGLKIAVIASIGLWGAIAFGIAELVHALS